MVKTIISAICVGVLILVGSIWECHLVDKEFAEFNQALSIVYEKIDNQTATIDDVYAVQKNWLEKKQTLHALIPHTEIKEVDFCTYEIVKNKLQDKWNDIVSVRGYVAVVEGNINKKQGIIKSYLKESKTKMVYSSKERDAKLAITEYKVIKENSLYSLVDINLLTGRKNQIRVHFKDIGNPLIGDKKYGATKDPLDRLALHSTKIGFAYNGKKYLFESQVPFKMINLFNK